MTFLEATTPNLLAPPSPTPSYAPSTAATSSPSLGPRASSARLKNTTVTATATKTSTDSTMAAASSSSSSSHVPRPTSSEYAWKKTPDGSPDGKQYWYRRQDIIGDFCLHWQQRFYGHGDMYATGLLQQKAAGDPTAPLLPAPVEPHHIRETMRRMRAQFPFVAVELVKRSDIHGVEPLPDIPKFVEKNVDLQVAQTYQIVRDDLDVERWLDRLITVHHEPRTREAAFDPLQPEHSDFVRHRSSQPEMANRLTVHFWPGSRAMGVPPRLTLEQCHNISDGIGTLLLYDDLLTVLADVLADATPVQIQWGPEVRNLPESIQDATAVQHETWQVSKEEKKQIDRLNSDRLNGKASAPNLIDRIGNKVVALTQRNNCKGWLRRKVLNKPLVALCRSIARSGDMLPLGLLPQSAANYEGPYGGTGVLVATLPPDEAKALLAAIKKRELTAAPFMEAAMHMATTWVRRERGLVLDAKKGADPANRVLGSFSNAVDRRNTLRPDQQRYHGICLGGLPTKIAASQVRWSDEAIANVRPSKLDARDKVPALISPADVETLSNAAAALSKQYNEGKTDPNWIRFSKATMFGTMETEYMFLTNENHYPSMLWLSSIGRIDGILKPSRPIPGSTAQTLEVSSSRILGRMSIRQPVLHVYSQRGEMVTQLSYADWYYDRQGADGKRVHRNGKLQKSKGDEHERDQSILQLWMEVFSEILKAFVETTNKTAQPTQQEMRA